MAGWGGEPADGSSWSLTRLGWTYGLLSAAVAAAATWAVTVRGLARAVVLLPALLPLARTDYARFFVSTFSEPAGLLGSVAVLCGLGIVLSTDRQDRVERLVGLVLLGGGGLVAGTAKPAYVPLVALAAAVAALVAVPVRAQRGWTTRLAGPLVGLVVLTAAAGPTRAALDWQSRSFSGVNAHNLAYTTVLVEVPGSASDLGLPERAAQAAGQSYWAPGGSAAPGAEVVAERPDEMTRRAWTVLAEHPAALAGAIGIALQATRGRDLPYLPSQPWGAATSAPPDGPLSGAQGAEADALREWLDAMTAPWWSTLLVVLAVAAGAMGLRRRGRLWSRLARVAGVAGLAGLGLAAVAVLGDGYFEIAKHVWLAAYLLDVALVALVGTAVAAAADRPVRRLATTT